MNAEDLSGHKLGLQFGNLRPAEAQQVAKKSSLCSPSLGGGIAVSGPGANGGSRRSAEPAGGSATTTSAPQVRTGGRNKPWRRPRRTRGREGGGARIPSVSIAVEQPVVRNDRAPATRHLPRRWSPRRPQETSRVANIVSRNCGSDSLGTLIEHQNHNSAWGSLWLTGQIDFSTRERRLAAAGAYAEMGRAIDAKDGAKAEATMRLMVMRSRESAVTPPCEGWCAWWAGLPSRRRRPRPSQRSPRPLTRALQPERLR